MRETVIKCDITGEIGAEPWEYEVGDKKYSIDLIEAERVKLVELLKTLDGYVEKSEETTSPAIPAQTKVSGPDAGAVRKWAAENFPEGHEIDGKVMNDRGRVPKGWQDAFLKAQEASNAE
ncbi:Lsr2 dimerization domain-containing protein [Streptomyces sp. NBC_01197]|uniref:Lsr2 dimerization domain-containing protein n=1 Tax=Streptomyces sp. NBC_01197 TaxID=2903768 RepID=UPI002E0E5CCD|nr:Lsr2 family protein [Streptomyces sp. NBC_01197]